jgi:hypothetical protein
MITSCQVSEKPNSGPVTAHTTMTSTARPKAHEESTASDVLLANLRRNSSMHYLLAHGAESSPFPRPLKQQSCHALMLTTAPGLTAERAA